MKRILDEMENKNLISREGDKINLTESGKLEGLALLLTNRQARKFLYKIMIGQFIENNISEKERAGKLETMVKDFNEHGSFEREEILNEFNETLNEINALLSN